jgi:hypothetical protein
MKTLQILLNKICLTNFNNVCSLGSQWATAKLAGFKSIALFIEMPIYTQWHYAQIKQGLVRNKSLLTTAIAMQIQLPARIWLYTSLFKQNVIGNTGGNVLNNPLTSMSKWDFRSLLRASKFTLWEKWPPPTLFTRCSCMCAVEVLTYFIGSDWILWELFQYYHMY